LIFSFDHEALYVLLGFMSSDYPLASSNLFTEQVCFK